jgi:prepilin-type processing-associated H-X9-DG protein
MTGFQADPAKLARHAADFPGLAEQAGSIHGELTTALAAAGQCWGADAAGQSFADGHVRPANGTLDQLAALPGRLTDVGDRCTATAARYQQVDEYSASVIGGVDGH